MVAANKKLLARDPLAVPTLMLASFVIVGATTSIAAMATERIPVWLGAMVMFISCFAAFTPMHDASHKAVANRRWVNELVGRLCAVVLLVPFGAFRYIHLTHHRHTNDPDRDPDFYSGAGVIWLLPLRWLTQDAVYYTVFFRAERPRREKVEAVVTVGLLSALIVALGTTLGWTTLLLGWLLPARLAIAALAFAFDYLPHHPHRVPASVDRFQATRILESPWLTPLMLFQNYHLVHHLYPGVPFYRYGVVWYAKREELIAKGARVRFSPTSPVKVTR